MVSSRSKHRFGRRRARTKIETWIAENFRKELRGAPKILSAPGFSFSDVAEKVLHLVNLASVRAVEEQLGRKVDPLRFRPNVVIDGLARFAELDWIGKAVRLPGLTLAGRKRTGRCAATNVDPKTGCRDMQIRALPRGGIRQRGFWHLPRGGIGWPHRGRRPDRTRGLRKGPARGRPLKLISSELNPERLRALRRRPASRPRRSPAPASPVAGVHAGASALAAELPPRLPELPRQARARE